MSLLTSSLGSKYFKILRYLISGSIAAATNLGTLYLLVSVLNFWYIVASGVSFIATFVVSFILQKFWTFNDHNLDVLKKQIGLSLVIAAVNLFLNMMYMYGLVAYAHLHYMYAQVLTTILIAIGSFIAYQYFVFKPETNPLTVDKLSL